MSGRVSDPRLLESGMCVTTPIGPLELLELLGRGKSGYSWKARTALGELVVYKAMHDEPCSFYRFSGNKVEHERGAWLVLSRAGIQLPEPLCFDPEGNCLVKEYIAGDTGCLLAADDRVDLELVRALRRMSLVAKAEGLNLDWFPPNFVRRGTELVYIDYEANPWDARWSLEHWGFWYWANAPGMRNLREQHSMSELEDEPGHPRHQGLESRVRAWCTES